MIKEQKDKIEVDENQVQKMFEVGAHYAYTKTKRHPSAKAFIFGVKNDTEIFDLEKTFVALEEAKNFVKKTLSAKAGNQILFVGSKSEARIIVRDVAENIDAPVVYNRWVGGTLTNFEMIKKRVDRLKKLLDEKEKGELIKYTKKERLQIDKEIEKLERKFSGISEMNTLPACLFVVDPKHEAIAVEEAKLMNIPVVALANSDCDARNIDYPIFANDSSLESIRFFTEEIASVCKGIIPQIDSSKK